MNKRSTMIVLAMGAINLVSAASITTVNSVIVNSRWWNDHPSSNLTVSNNYPSSVAISDNNLGGGGVGGANRHVVWLSNDGGATRFAHDGGNDTFEVRVTLLLDSNKPAGAFPRYVEAGPLCRTPVIGGWWSDHQFIFTNDGETAGFGVPCPFWSGTVQSGYTYPQGVSVNAGYRYYRDSADNKMKWVWIYGPYESAPLTLETITGGEGTWDFSKYGYRPNGYTWNGGTPMPTELGFYFQIMAQNSATPVDASLTLGNWSVKSIGIKGIATLNDISTSMLGEAVTVEVGTQTMNTIVDTLGRFSFSRTVAPGTYTAYVKGRTHLRKAIPGVVVNADGADLGSVSLTNGDVDGDNEVGPGDFGQLSSAFGSVDGDGNWNANADLDRDGEVGPSDFGILSANFGESGD